MDKDLQDRLSWLVEELTEEERTLLFDDENFIPEPEADPEPIAPGRKRRLTYAEKQERRRLEELDPVEERSVPVVKKKGIKGLVFLAILESLGILLLIGWWMQWRL